ncbi:MAG: hypothetical protein JST70_02360 [Bacteroidetes bacterium]|nr:hypothetical protein [Bacteroidota bacterium]
MKEYLFSDRICTDYGGYKRLADFYNWCLKFRDQQIRLSFNDLEFFDGNMCALLQAMMYKLYYSRNISFATDYDILRQKFEVMFRNGFIESNNDDDRQSVVPIKAFSPDSKEQFVDYVDNYLLCHRGVPEHLDANLKAKISDDLLEIFCNVNFHANTKELLFVGGQYYPKQKTLKFTMVDLGDGFLPKINKATNGLIDNALSAINWAVEGNSSKSLEQTPGGLGLKNIYSYCKEKLGVLQIATGNGFWSSDYENSLFEGGRIIQNPFIGTTINLFFTNN